MLAYTYLASPEDISNFGANQLAAYKYVALFDFGSDVEDITKTEFNLMCASLSRFMHEDCLIIRADELIEAPEECFIRPIYQIFESQPHPTPHIAIATIFAGEDDKLLLNPAYHPLDMSDHTESRYPWFESLNQCLEKLKVLLAVSSIDDFTIPPLPPKVQSTCCPNGKKIKELRQKFGSIQYVTEELKIDSTHQAACPVSRNTLQAAENYAPITNSNLAQISRFLGVTSTELKFDQVVPIRDVFKELRKQSGMSVDELAQHFGIGQTMFFDFLEQADNLSSEKIRFVFSKYKGLIKSLKFKELIDVDATEHLTQD